MENIYFRTFDGPIDLLLQMIEKNKLDICEVSISKVADEYIEYINSLSDINLDRFSDFIYMASRLIQIKSRKMLLFKEEDADDETVELIKQLEVYSKFKHLSFKLEKLYDENNFKYFEKKPDEFLIVEEFDFNKLCLVNLPIEILFKSEEKKQEIKIAFKERKSIENKIKFIKEYISQKDKLFFDEILEEYNKEESIVSLLGMLQLSKEEIVKMLQEQNFDRILLESIKEKYSVKH